jgi:hypothetical protein
MTIAAAESTPLDDIRARAAEILAVDRHRAKSCWRSGRPA